MIEGTCIGIRISGIIWLPSVDLENGEFPFIYI